MKYLEAKRSLAPTIENKMQDGTRVDQRAPVTPPTPPTVRPEVIKLADELNVDLNRVVGTGANGTILMRDVRDAANRKKTEDKLNESND